MSSFIRDRVKGFLENIEDSPLGGAANMLKNYVWGESMIDMAASFLENLPWLPWTDSFGPHSREGWLKKRGPVHGWQWPERKVRLYRMALVCYADEDCEQQKTYIPLTCASTVACFRDDDALGDAIKEAGSVPFGFVVDPNPFAGKRRSLFYFDAGEEETLEAWVSAIRSVVCSMSSQKTIVCIAGLASTSMQMRRPEAEGRAAEWSTAYCSIRTIATAPRDLLEAMTMRQVERTLSDGTTATGVANAEGVDVRPHMGIQGIASLNPGESLTPINVWRELVDTLSPDYNLLAFSYDWRRWGDLKFAEETVQRFRAIFEAIRKNGMKPAAIIAHSMGCSLALYCLSELGKAWAREFVDQMIMVAPAPMGSPKMMPSWANSVVAAAKTEEGDKCQSSIFPVGRILDPVQDMISDMTSTWACMIAEMPVTVGQIKPWPDDCPLVVTPSRTYCLADTGQFLQDVDASVQGRGLGPAIWPNVKRLAEKMAVPLVDTRIIYGVGIDTMSQLEYESDDLGAAPTIKAVDRGDGTVLASTVEILAEAWNQELKEEPVEVRLFPGPEDQDHQHLIACTFTQELVPKLLERIEE
eukprot:TRINITY_DN74631_c0_g1_i1.p1 TRINITY_DN74631_c0_g1~~TRINITY_DN74631_c0_g1_i1.p1  ORF type:complete len:584 (-),score=84.00 TRINITY_DN74631_c0_g1_i1:268-2019(-)